MAYIPYGAYWSSPFARWQGSLSHLHSMRFAAEVTKQGFAERSLTPEMFDFCAYGMTVIQPNSFYGAPWFTAMIGAEYLAGPTVNQACATGPRLLATAIGEMALGNASTALIASGDRTSNGAHVYYPAPAGPGSSEDWVLGSFNNDPWGRCAMVDTADNVAKRYGIETKEQHDVVLYRHEQYGAALADERAFQKRYMLEVAIPDAGFRKTVGTLSEDEGVYPAKPEKIATLKPVRPDGSVTFAGQTHPADGAAGMVVVDTVERAMELAGDGPLVEVLAFGQSREEKAHMPAAPIKATEVALQKAGLSIADVTAIKSHNPFAVNDIAFARAFDLDWKTINNFGCSLIWGHPQGPTGLRGMIELIEELALKGGGIGLFQGCAAGDSALAVLIKVN